MNKTKWIIFAVVVLAIFGGIYFVNKDKNTEFTGDASQIITEGPIADHVIGDTKNKKVILIEYGDFQCPGCGRAYPVIKQLKEKHKDKLTFVFRNMPLTNIHPNAIAAATAAEAAGLQGKFWQMHDMLYEQQEGWKEISVAQRNAVFEGYADALGLDVTRYKQDVSSPAIVAKINRDRAVAKKIGVDQTPSFVLNGQKIDPAIATDPEKLTAAVELAITTAFPTKK